MDDDSNEHNGTERDPAQRQNVIKTTEHLFSSLQPARRAWHRSTCIAFAGKPILKSGDSSTGKRVRRTRGAVESVQESLVLFFTEGDNSEQYRLFFTWIYHFEVQPTRLPN